MSLPSRRKRGKEQNKDIIIYTEGTETEVHYFNTLRQLLRTPSVKIKVKGVGKASTNLVRHAIGDTKNRSGIKSVWVVFDKDAVDASEIQRSYKLAKENDINVGFSNCNFEVWMLLHFEKLKYPSVVDKRIVYTKLEKYLKVKKYEQYKSSLNLIQQIASKYLEAVENNEDLLAQGCSQNCSPYTDIVYLVKDILN